MPCSKSGATLRLEWALKGRAEANKTLLKAKEAFVREHALHAAGDTVEVNSGYSHEGKKILVTRAGFCYATRFSGGRIDIDHYGPKKGAFAAIVYRGNVIKADGKPGKNVAIHVQLVGTVDAPPQAGD